ncbi:MAG: hypothetical protein Q8S13_14020 [Dehalococcoidia bacterium]|nr:hypothetical protein [Dehalococcoidia bacterium]
MIRVEGPWRTLMQMTGCDPSCHACGRKLGPDDYGDFTPALTLYDPIWNGGAKVLEAFRCAACIDVGRPVRAEDLLEMMTAACDQGGFFEAMARMGFTRGTRMLELYVEVGVRGVQNPRGVPIEGPGLWVGSGQELFDVWLNGGLYWITYDAMTKTAPEAVREEWRRVVGRPTP